MKLVDNFQINFDDEEILQLLSGNREKTKNRKPNTKLISEINDLQKVAMKLIEPKAIYEKFSSEKLLPRFLFNKSDFTILAVCTIGLELEQQSETALKEGLLSKGVILDAIASSITEDIATQLYDLIVNEMLESNPKIQYSHKFSPGYCQWVLEKGQDLIFEKLPASKIGVKLSQSKMMVPRKSISFAINFGSKVDRMLGLRECDTCELENCSYRR